MLENLQVILKLAVAGAVMVAGLAIMADAMASLGVERRLYRWCIRFAAIAAAFGVVLEYGPLGLAAAALVVGLLFPAVIMLAARALVLLTWRHTRKLYPEEPNTAPVELMTFAGATRLLWALEYKC